MKTMILLTAIALTACNAKVTSDTITCDESSSFCTSHADPTDSCGKIVDSEPAPYGWACCQNETTAQVFFYDGTSTTNSCTGNLTCQSGVCK